MKSLADHGFDARLLADTRAALDAWESSGGGPTSTLTGSGAIEVLERRFARLCGVSHALALPNGTLALRLALAAAGVGHGDEVLLPALDWPAAAAATLSLSARPRSVDSLADSAGIDPAAVATGVSSATKAVVVTHFAGTPADVPRVRAICEERGVAVIEDACQALGARLGGRQVGGLGTVGVFSLGPGKLIDAGEGGVLVTDDDRLYERAVRMSQSPVRQLLVGTHPPELCALTIRIHPLAAILAIGELDTLDAELARRRALAEEIIFRARAIPRVTLWSEAPGERFAWSCVPAILSPGQEKALAHAGLVASPLGCHYIPQVLGEGKARTHKAQSLAPMLHRLHLSD